MQDEFGSIPELLAEFEDEKRYLSNQKLLHDPKQRKRNQNNRYTLKSKLRGLVRAGTPTFEPQDNAQIVSAARDVWQQLQRWRASRVEIARV